METITSQAATMCSDVGDNHEEMEPDEVSSEVLTRWSRTQQSMTQIVSLN